MAQVHGQRQHRLRQCGLQLPRTPDGARPAGPQLQRCGGADGRARGPLGERQDHGDAAPAALLRPYPGIHQDRRRGPAAVRRGLVAPPARLRWAGASPLRHVPRRQCALRMFRGDQGGGGGSCARGKHGLCVQRRRRVERQVGHSWPAVERWAEATLCDRQGSSPTSADPHPRRGHICPGLGLRALGTAGTGDRGVWAHHLHDRPPAEHHLSVRPDPRPRCRPGRGKRHGRGAHGKGGRLPQPRTAGRRARLSASVAARSPFSSPERLPHYCLATALVPATFCCKAGGSAGSSPRIGAQEQSVLARTCDGIRAKEETQSCLVQFTWESAPE
mmetsp:Transcript_15029/g.38637  ORF Transcript_15029/g.38637 Transcript_15029/m.38637 type:complete len:331 (+) Transcript_15029:709-1701(+)